MAGCIPHSDHWATFFEEFKPTERELLEAEASENFHNFLKAKMMPLAFSTQMIRPYTLDAIFEGKGSAIQDLATVCWNLAVALMYKAEARPWRLADVPAGTCFIGVSFYREKPVFGGNIGTSMAQVFSPEGEGLVLRGERFEWPRKRSPHLERDAAKRLLEKAVALYAEHTRQKPTRVVVHKSSKFWGEELEGFQSALDGIPTHDFVTVAERARRIRFYTLHFSRQVGIILRELPPGTTPQTRYRFYM